MVEPLGSLKPTTLNTFKCPTLPNPSPQLKYPSTFVYGTVLFRVVEYKTAEMIPWAPPNISTYQYEISNHPLRDPWNSKTEQVIRDYCRLPPLYHNRNSQGDQ
jgi:hypothetical protein